MKSKESSRILLVQHDSRQRNTLKGVLERNGITTVTTDTATHALHLQEKDKFKVILAVDHFEDMPAMELVALIRNEDEKTSIIVVSSEPDQDEKTECMRLGATDYIENSNNRNPLIKFIQRLIK